MSDLIFSLLRTALQVAGTWIATTYSLTCADLPAGTACEAGDVGGAIAGLVLLGGATIWTVVSRVLQKKKYEKAVAAPAGETGL
jgi:hypothetical protein